MTALAWIQISISSISTHKSYKLSIEPDHNDHDTTDIVFGTDDEDEHHLN